MISPAVPMHVCLTRQMYHVSARPTFAGSCARKSLVFPSRPGTPSSLREAFRVPEEEQPPSAEVPGAFLSWSVSQSRFLTLRAPRRTGRRRQSVCTGGADGTPALPRVCGEN